MEDPLVLIDHNDRGVTTLTLNRPEKRNALSINLMEQLCQAIEETIENSSQRVIILKGEGTVFCAGLDLKEAQKSFAD